MVEYHLSKEEWNSPENGLNFILSETSKTQQDKCCMVYHPQNQLSKKIGSKYFVYYSYMKMLQGYNFKSLYLFG